MKRATLCTGLALTLVLSAAVLFAAESKPKVETFSGNVVRVIDGDTLVLLVGKARRTIRLAGIDAPELKQAFGDEAKKVLSKRLSRKTVEVRAIGKERDGRLPGVVRLEGRCVNVDLVREGHAWHDAEANDSRTLAKAEKEARAEKRGLWAQPEPMPPWEWRRIEEAKENPNAAEHEPDATEATKEKAYWLNMQSNVRHNSGCRFYKKTAKGRPCKPDEGKACKICGG